jgi:hypothetical protein
MSTRTTAQQFTLDEDAAAETGFAERYPVEDNHSAALAIDQAAHGDDEDLIITGPDGWTFYADLLANNDGDLDAYRILVQPPGANFLLASTVECIPWPEGSDTLDVLRRAVDAANELIREYQQR